MKKSAFLHKPRDTKIKARENWDSDTGFLFLSCFLMILKDVMPIATFIAQIDNKIENKKFSVLVSLKLLYLTEKFKGPTIGLQ